MIAIALFTDLPRVSLGGTTREGVCLGLEERLPRWWGDFQHGGATCQLVLWLVGPICSSSSLPIGSWGSWFLEPQNQSLRGVGRSYLTVRPDTEATMLAPSSSRHCARPLL